MKPTDLRIGNLFYPINRRNKVHLPDEIPMKIYTIGLFEVEALMPHLNPAHQEFLHKISLGDIVGIELTEEWLIRFGFKKEIIGYSIDISYFENEFKTLVVDLSQGILIRNGELNKNRIDDVLISIFNTDKHGKIYVHQLQNFYFTFKREDLKYTYEKV